MGWPSTEHREKRLTEMRLESTDGPSAYIFGKFLKGNEAVFPAKSNRGSSRRFCQANRLPRPSLPKHREHRRARTSPVYRDPFLSPRHR